MVARDEAAGLAALSICESLIIALVEKGILGAEEARNALDDAAAAHRNLELPESERQKHLQAAHLIEQLITQVTAARQSPP